MCPNINSRSNQSQYSRGPSSTQLLDRYGRDVIFCDGVQICNNFNQSKGCSKRTANSVTFVSGVNFMAIENFSVLEPGTCKTINEQNQMAVKMEANNLMLELND